MLAASKGRAPVPLKQPPLLKTKGPISCKPLGHSHVNSHRRSHGDVLFIAEQEGALRAEATQALSWLTEGPWDGLRPACLWVCQAFWEFMSTQITPSTTGRSESQGPDSCLVSSTHSPEHLFPAP